MISTPQRAHCAPKSFITAAVQRSRACGKSDAAHQGPEEAVHANTHWFSYQTSINEIKDSVVRPVFFFFYMRQLSD